MPASPGHWVPRTATSSTRIGPLDLIGRVVAAVAVPATADIEGGYGSDAAGVAETVAELGALGVSRVSLGSGVAQVAYAAARRAARDLFGTGGCDSLADGIAFAELNALLSEPQ